MTVRTVIWHKNELECNKKKAKEYHAKANELKAAAHLLDKQNNFRQFQLDTAMEKKKIAYDEDKYLRKSLAEWDRRAIRLG